MRKFDITDKLELSGNPCLVIAGQELEVNADAATMLKIMDTYSKASKDDTGFVKMVMDVYEVIFPEASRRKIEEMKLSFPDLMVVINSARKIISGEDPNTPEEDDLGEGATHTTT